MFSSEFVWCDLSTFDIAKAVAFYADVFGWTRHASDGIEDDEYVLLDAKDNSAAGIYTIPNSLQEKHPPSFWMSYVQVKLLEDALDLAVSLGATCEIEPTIYDSNIHFSLIRDPSGAELTLYEGPELAGRDSLGRPGRMTWNELHVPSLESVDAFYCRLFGWEVVPDPSTSNRHIVQSNKGDPIASLLVLDEAVKGPENYWAVYFSVLEMDVTLQAVEKNGGTIVVQPHAEIGQYALASDDQGAAFCISAS